jgi:branched-chain amino acid aminotransferase
VAAFAEEYEIVKLGEITVYAGGRFCAYENAKVGLLTHGLQYGTGCFEGIRGYWVAADQELYVVQLREHYERLAVSAKILMMELPASVDELIDVTIELCARNRFETDIYIRPCIFKAAEDIGVRLHNVPDAFAIIPVPFTSYLDASGGLRANQLLAPRG